MPTNDSCVYKKAPIIYREIDFEFVVPKTGKYSIKLPPYSPKFYYKNELNFKI